MRRSPLSQTCIALAFAAFLCGLGAGAFLMPEAGAVSLLVALTGAVLVLAFRVYEARAVAQEERIGVLEAHRKAVERQNDRLEALSDSIARALAAVLNGGPDAGAPASRVPALAAALGREMTLDADALSTLRTAALLHDIGRLRVSPDIWGKPGPLTEEEWQEVRAHPSGGADLLRAVHMPPAVEEIVRAHQERWDGTGYPARLRGAAIPQGARILAVAAAYDAMTSHRPWRAAVCHREALDTLRAEAGHAFDPAVVVAFERSAKRGDFLDAATAPGQNDKGPAPSEEVAGPLGADERI